MKISGTYTLPLARERAYHAMQNPDVLVQCMPGCESLEATGDQEYAMKMKMALAAISGQFQGKVKIADAAPPERFKLIVEGTGKIGFMKGEGALELTEAGDASTQVAYEGDVQVGGTIAAVGQRLIDTTAKMMIRKFFEKLVEVTAGMR